MEQKFDLSCLGNGSSISTSMIHWWWFGLDSPFKHIHPTQADPEEEDESANTSQARTTQDLAMYQEFFMELTDFEEVNIVSVILSVYNERLNQY